jgi:hypothetical protein
MTFHYQQHTITANVEVVVDASDEDNSFTRHFHMSGEELTHNEYSLQKICYYCKLIRSKNHL